MAKDMANYRRVVTGAITAITPEVIAGLDPAIHRPIIRYSGARKARTRNLEIPGLVFRTISE